jgi:hypothetical protein
MSTRLRRLRQLEERVHGQGFVVEMPNGAQLSMRVRDELGLVLEGFNRQHRALMGEPDPPTKFDPVLNSLSACSRVEADSPMIHLAADQAQQAKHERLTGETRLALKSLEIAKKGEL